ncbi:MAG: hypothetical protein ACHREM_33335, partial [Polyangiales bacterium]
MCVGLLASALVACKRTDDDVVAREPKKKHRAKSESTSDEPEKIAARIVMSRAKHDGYALLEPTAEAAPTTLAIDREGKADYLWAPPGGRALFVGIQEPRRRVLRRGIVRGNKLVTDDEVFDDDFKGGVDAASADASALLGSRESGAGATLRTTFVLLRSGKTPLVIGSLRASGGAAISSDGRRALVAGPRESCTAPWIGNCPYHVYSVDLGAAAPSLTPLDAPTVGASYQPRFHPLDPDVVLFQSTRASAESCADLNHCRHDLYEGPFDGASPARLIRKGAFGLAISASAAHWGFQSLEDSDCTALPCSTASL